MKKYCDISILFVLYDESVEIIFKSLEKIKNFNIIIIDNKGDEKLKNEIENKYQIEKYFLSKKNLGYSKGYNKAINFCDTEFVFIKNADCFIDEIDIIKLYDYINLHQDCGIVSPTSYDKNGNLSYNGGLLPENEKTKEILNICGDVCVQKVLGAAMFMRTKDLKKIGMFNENLFIYFSDDDLCKKIKNIKKYIAQLYSSRSVHTHGVTKVKNIFKKTYLRELYFTLDELIYFNEINDIRYIELKSKISSYLIKIFVNLITLNIIKSLKYYSRIYAYIKFFNYKKSKSSKT